MEPLLDIHREMNRLFDDVLQGTGASDRRGMMTMPKVDVHEKNGELCVFAELPGVAEKDVEVQLHGDMLSISGEKQSEYEEGDRSSHYVMERSYGRFQRTIPLPFTPKPEDVKASFENGVLRIRMPAQDGQRAHKIQIGSGTGQDKQLGSSAASSATQKQTPGAGEQKH
jgi:HSP20 family protein